VDTPVQAHSIQAASQLSESRGCSSDIGVHTLSACGGQGENGAAARHFIRHDNSRVGLGATIPQGRRSSGLEKLGWDPCPATLRPGRCPVQHRPCLCGRNLCRSGSALNGPSSALSARQCILFVVQTGLGSSFCGKIAITPYLKAIRLGALHVLGSHDVEIVDDVTWGVTIEDWGLNLSQAKAIFYAPCQL
jgi:hypothetical protein